MAEAGADHGLEGKAADKLPRAHKRCINKDCREVLSLATKVSGPAGRPGGRVHSPPPSPACRPGDAANTTVVALQYCKKCNTVQFERRASGKQHGRQGGDEEGGVGAGCCAPPRRRMPDV